MEQLEKNPIKAHWNYSNDSPLSVLLNITDPTLLLLNWHQLCCFLLVSTIQDSSAF